MAVNRMRFKKITSIISNLYINTHLWIFLTCIGVWILVLQNFMRDNGKDVYVEGGTIKAEVNGSVKIPNMVDVNIQGINGHSDCFYNNGYSHPNKYYRIPIINE
jgi:hypothetical protein